MGTVHHYPQSKLANQWVGFTAVIGWVRQFSKLQNLWTSTIQSCGKLCGVQLGLVLHKTFTRCGLHNVVIILIAPCKNLGYAVYAQPREDVAQFAHNTSSA